MKSPVATIVLALVSLAGLDVNGMFAQQALVKRNFEAEIQTALASAKAAAGFEFLGTLVRTCLLPQSGGESTSDNVQGYVTNRPLPRRATPGTLNRQRFLTISISSAASSTHPGL